MMAQWEYGNLRGNMKAAVVWSYSSQSSIAWVHTRQRRCAHLGSRAELSCMASVANTMRADIWSALDGMAPSSTGRL